MSAEDIGRVILAIVAIGTIWLIVLAWLDLRQQTSDIGRVGGVLALAALAWVLYHVGRPLLGL